MRPRPWTPKEEAQLRISYQHFTTTQIARTLERTVGSVEKKIKRMGLSKGYKTAYTPAMDAAIINGYPHRFNADLAQELGITQKQLKTRAKKLGVTKAADFCDKHKAEIDRRRSAGLAVARDNGFVSYWAREGVTPPMGYFHTHPDRPREEIERRVKTFLKVRKSEERRVLFAQPQKTRMIVKNLKHV